TTAVLFGAFHLNPWQFPGAVGLGVIFGWWFVRTGSLVPCIFGHAFVNGLATLPVLLAAGDDPPPMPDPVTHLPVGLVVAWRCARVSASGCCEGRSRRCRPVPSRSPRSSRHELKALSGPRVQNLCAKGWPLRCSRRSRWI